MATLVNKKDLCKLVNSLALLVGAFEDGRDISQYELDPEDDRLVEEMNQTVRLGQNMIKNLDMKRISIEEWVLILLWEAYPEGAAKNQLASREMAELIRRWYGK